MELNILNSLIGSKTIEEDFLDLLKRYPEVLRCIPLLLAVRADEIYCQDSDGGVLYSFKKPEKFLFTEEDYSKYAYFMRQTGLFDLLEHHMIHSLVDYATGVETGLDLSLIHIYILSVVVISAIFSAIYDPSQGLLNSILNLFRGPAGAEDPILWLGSRKLVIYSIAIAMVWQAIGYYMVMYMASMANVRCV